MWIGDVSENFATLQEIKKENKELKSRLEEMTTENNRLQQNSATLERYKELYKMDQNTADYLMDTSPWDELKEKIKIYALGVVSNESCAKA